MNNGLQLTVAKKTRVLFVCAGNTCRSVLAEYIARQKFGVILEVVSAGLRPGTDEDAKSAVYTLKTLLNIDASTHRPRDVRDFDVSAFDLVIPMDNHIARELQRLFPALSLERLVRWRIEDPYGDDLAEYRRCANKIYGELKKLILYIKPRNGQF